MLFVFWKLVFDPKNVVMFGRCVGLMIIFIDSSLMICFLKLLSYFVVFDTCFNVLTLQELTWQWNITMVSRKIPL